MKALLIRADGSQEEVEVAGLAEYQSFVGGYIELVRLPGGNVLYCDEDGKQKNLPMNMLATDLAQIPGDVIVGDVLIFGPGDDEGNDTDWPGYSDE